MPERRDGARGYEAVGIIMAIPLLAKIVSSTFSGSSQDRTPPPTMDTKTDDKEPGTHQGPYKIDDAPIATTATKPQTILSTSDLTLPDRQCPLCLSPRGVSPESGGTCVTECGHVFCWSCIQEWGHEKVKFFGRLFSSVRGELMDSVSRRKSVHYVGRR